MLYCGKWAYLDNLTLSLPGTPGPYLAYLARTGLAEEHTWPYLARPLVLSRARAVVRVARLLSSEHVFGA